jgi:hypothetical protein
MSRVDEKVSAKPMGSIKGIHPVIERRIVSRKHYDESRMLYTSGVFECEAVALHAVLLDLPTGQVVDSADGINLGLGRSYYQSGTKRVEERRGN